MVVREEKHRQMAWCSRVKKGLADDVGQRNADPEQQVYVWVVVRNFRLGAVIRFWFWPS